MRKLLLILLFVSCSKDTILEGTEIKPCLKKCNLNLVQVTKQGIHLTISSIPKTVDCNTSETPFDVVKNNEGKTIQYKVYKCN